VEFDAAHGGEAGRETGCIPRAMRVGSVRIDPGATSLAGRNTGTTK
jgi:hypothetical protein